MKKFLSVLGALSLTATSSAMVIACGTEKTEDGSNNPDPVDPVYKVDQELVNLSTQRAQSLVIGDQFNLSQKAVYNTINSDQTKYRELFNEASTKNLNLANSGLGLPGGIFNEFVPEDFDLNTILGSIVGGDIDLGAFLPGKGAEQITNIINTTLPIIASIFSDLGKAFDTLFNLLLGENNTNAIPDTIANVILSAIKSIDTSLPSEKIMPILNAINTGTDLTRFSELSVNQLNTTFVLALIEGIKFGLEPNYEGIDLVEKSSDGWIAIDISDGVKYLYQNIANGNISNFNLNYNLPKVIESFLTSISALNLILSTYRTPEISFNDESVDYSANLFSETENNKEYVTWQGNVLLKDLLVVTNVVENPDDNDRTEIDDVEPRNLKGLNYGELIANIQYYFGNGQYGLQKLLYILLFDGVYQTSLSDFLMYFLPEVAGDKQVMAIVQYIPDAIIIPLVNNEKLNLQSLTTKTAWGSLKGALENQFPALKGKVAEFLVSIDDAFGDHVFDTLYKGDLRDVLKTIKVVLGETTYNDLINGINDLIGDEKLNLETFLTKLKLKQIVALFTKKSPNINIPTYAGYYTNKTIQELVIELGKTFSISMNATSGDLREYFLDFDVLETMVQEFLYGDETNTSLLKQIEKLITKKPGIPPVDKDPIKISQILEILGYVDNSERMVKADSFLGRLIAFLAPLPPVTKFGEIDVIKFDDLADTHNILSWFFNGITKFLPHLIEDDSITNFVNNIYMAKEKVFKPVVEEGLSGVPYEGVTLFRNKTGLKGYTFNLFFNPNEISFADGTKIKGDISVYTFTVSREKPTDQFSFTNVDKLIIK